MSGKGEHNKGKERKTLLFLFSRARAHPLLLSPTTTHEKKKKKKSNSSTPLLFILFSLLSLNSPVLDRAVGLQALQLGQHHRALRGHGPAEPDHRRAADEVDDRLDGRVRLVEEGEKGGVGARGRVGELGVGGGVLGGGGGGGGRGGCGGGGGGLRERVGERRSKG